MRARQWMAAVGICLLVGPGLLAQDARQRIERGKAATAYVELQDGSATAVCIDPKGIFLTNEHVVYGLPAGTTFTLVLDPNGEKPRELLAKVLRADRRTDLAVVQVVDAEGQEFPFLTLGSDAELYETMTVTAFGYPFGKKLSSDKEQYPEITVNVGRVSSLRKSQGKLDQIQLDAQVNPGNSGGPLTDEAGHIIGIVNAGVLGTGVNFAIPVSHAKALLNRPTIAFAPAVIPAASKYEEIELEAVIDPFIGTLTDVRVELELFTIGQPPRTVTAERRGDRHYAFKLRPLVVSPAAAPAQLAAVFEFDGGRAVGQVADQRIYIDQTAIHLSEIRSLQWSDGVLVRRADGSQITGAKIDPVTINVELGKAQVPLNLTRAKRIDFAPLQDQGRVRYKLSVLGESVLASTRGELPIEGLGRLGAQPPAIDFVPLAEGARKIDLNDTIVDAVQGGGGRYLLLHLVRGRQVAVYDVNEARIVERIPLAGDFVWMAAGLDHFVLVDPRDRTIERWNFANFEQEAVDRLPGENFVQSIAMGYAGQGPLLVRTIPATGSGNRTLLLYDTLSMQVLNQDLPGSSMPTRDVHLRASAAGDLFTISPIDGDGAEAVKITAAGPQFRKIDRSKLRLALPAIDSKTIQAGPGNTFDENLKPVGQPGAGVGAGNVIPSTHARLGVFVPEGSADRATLWNLRDQQKVCDLPALGLGQAPNNTLSIDIPVQRVTPGPVVAGPVVRGPMVPSPGVPMPGMRGPSVPMPGVPMPGVRGPGVPMPGPAARGPAVRGPTPGAAARNAARGPAARGPTVPMPGPRGPVVPTPNVPRPGVIQNGPIVQNGIVTARITLVSNFTIEKRVLFIPQAKQLIRIPYAGDQLLVDRFDLGEAPATDMCVVSVGPNRYRPGELFQHRIELISPAADLEYAVKEGPAGMSVSANGLVTWSPPQDLSAARVNVTIAISAAGGKSIEERFVLSDGRD